MIAAYPLAWPESMPRYKPTRVAGPFRTGLPGALANVEKSLKDFGADSGQKVAEIVLSSNVTLGSYRPADPGVAAWFLWGGEQVCIPVDRYSTVEANLQAIHHIIEARRVELRHGTLALVKATFRGLQALPPPPDWRDVLGLPKQGVITAEDVEAAYRMKARRSHPDHGGTADAMSMVNSARVRALAELEPAK